jgi:hypothetical protein
VCGGAAGVVVRKQVRYMHFRCPIVLPAYLGQEGLLPPFICLLRTAECVCARRGVKQLALHARICAYYCMVTIDEHSNNRIGIPQCLPTYVLARQTACVIEECAVCH